MAVLVNLLTGTGSYPNPGDAEAVLGKLSDDQISIIVDGVAQTLIGGDNTTFTKKDLREAAEKIVNKVRV